MSIYLKKILLRAIISIVITGSQGAAFAAPFAYISNYASNNVSVIDTGTNSVVATVPVGNGPFSGAVNPEGYKVLCS